MASGGDGILTVLDSARIIQELLCTYIVGRDQS